MTTESTLYLTLKRKAFDVMITGEKQEEYRKESKWIMSRLLESRSGCSRRYDYVKFVNGYKKTSPSFIVEYKGWEVVNDIDKTYSNGLKVKAERLICIKLGDKKKTD